MEICDWILAVLGVWLGVCFVVMCAKFLSSKTPLDDHDQDDYAEWLDPNETRI